MKQLLDKGIILYTFLFYVYSIAYSLFALFLLNRFPDYTDLKYTQISALLFLTALYLLIPLIKEVYFFSKASEQVKNKLKQVRFHGLRLFQYYDRMLLNRNYWKVLENHPLVQITDGAIGSLGEGDITGTCQAIVEVNNYLFEYLGKAVDRRGTINAFLYFYRHLSQEAIVKKNQRVLSLILNSIEDMHFLAAGKQFLWSELIELNRFIEEFLGACLRNSLDSVVNEGAYVLQFINEKHLEKNCPLPKELLDFDGGTLKIKDLPKNRGHDKALQWRQVGREYIRIMASVAEEAINQSRSSIACNYSRAFISLVNKVIELNNLSDEMKRQIAGYAYYHARDITERILKFNLWDLSKLPFPFDEFQIDRALATKAEYSKELLLQYSEAIITLAKYKVLDSFYLNEYGAFGRGLTRKLEEDAIYRQSFKLVIDTLEKVRQIVANQNSVPGGENIYSEVYKQTLSLKNWLKSQKAKKKYFVWINKKLRKFDKRLVGKMKSKRYSNNWPDRIR